MGLSVKAIVWKGIYFSIKTTWREKCSLLFLTSRHLKPLWLESWSRYTHGFEIGSNFDLMYGFYQGKHKQPNVLKLVQLGDFWKIISNGDRLSNVGVGNLLIECVAVVKVKDQNFIGMLAWDNNTFQFSRCVDAIFFHTHFVVGWVVLV